MYRELVAPYIFVQNAHNIVVMIYIVSFVTGVINGLFASGAGQVLVFFLIYITKIDTHKARATSMLCTSIASVFSVISYFKMTEFKAVELLIVIICGLAFGALGAKIMKKLNANLLNLISGFVIFSLSMYNIISRWV